MENERRKRRLFSLIIKRNNILLPDEADELRALLRAEGKVLITERIYFNEEVQRENNLQI